MEVFLLTRIISTVFRSQEESDGVCFEERDYLGVYSTLTKAVDGLRYQHGDFYDKHNKEDQYDLISIEDEELEKDNLVNIFIRKNYVQVEVSEVEDIEVSTSMHKDVIVRYSILIKKVDDAD